MVPEHEPGKNSGISFVTRPGGPTPGIRGQAPLIAVIFGVLLLLIAGPALFWGQGFLTAVWGGDTVLVVGNMKLGEGLVRVEDREIYIQVNPLQEHLDPNFFWDEKEKTAVITTADRVVRMHSDTISAEINMEPVELELPLIETGNGLFVPLLFLADFYGITVSYFPEMNTVAIDKNDDPAFTGEVTARSVRLREGPGYRQRTLEILERGERLISWESGEGWSLVRSERGVLGYLPGKSFRVAGKHNKPGTPDPGLRENVRRPEYPIVMTWEFAYSPPRVDEIGDMPSLQVVSPTWFHLKDGEGNIKNLADPSYMNWARERGYHVWGLFSNSFDPDITAQVLTSSSRRREVIRRLLFLAHLYDLDGINIDFENFSARYRDHFTQFIRELAPLCREKGLVLSVDVTFPSRSEYWSLGYDRGALAEAVDYIIVMAYDEHWAGSPVAGSVASLPWVERNLKQVLKEVPAHKLILGIPFYSRVWEIEYLEGGHEKVTSKAYSMHNINSIIARKGVAPSPDPDTRQNKAVFSEQGRTFKIWLEDAYSIRQRLELVKEHKLAGAAAWRRGLETPEIWMLFEEVLGER